MRKALMIIGLSLSIAPTIGPLVHAGKPLSSKKAHGLIDKLYDGDPAKRAKAQKALIKANDISLAPILVESVFFNENGRRETIAVLEALTGESHGSDYHAWISYIGEREDIQPKQGYLAYKAKLYGWIDPALRDFFKESYARTIRTVEILSGGVRKDGIPALFQPKFIPGDQADYLEDDEAVFGVAINGDVRAYPHRILDWHEMANDVVGGVSVSLSYCTLCGAGILFDTRTGEGSPSYTFGSSGLLYRSNKLMYDHQTKTLWSNLTGEPVMGPLVGQGITLKVLPLTVTTWGAWRKANPSTKTLALETGYVRRYEPGAAYKDYFESPDTRFPVWNAPAKEAGLGAKDWMWVVVLDGRRKAYPLKILEKQAFLRDKIGDDPIVLITDPATGSVRVYQTKDHEVKEEGDRLLTGKGQTLNLTEDALVSADGEIKLRRVPGHRAYWFSWGSFFPGTETYGVPER